MIGQKILHYQITEKLGEGGMGVVFKAEDTKLHRTVALKFINPEALEGYAEKDRLLEEARAAAGLNHPNICTIYEINEVDDKAFIAMEFVEGLTLRDKVLSERIEVTDALHYLVQIAEGLKETHQRGMVHRDIKSANIMIRPDSRAVIMDFGLARQADQIRPDERFSSGGTSAYMSPEQARGEGVDQRTDIWSLGVVLYEMLAGRLPFRGEYEQAVIYSIVNESHDSVTKHRPDVPANIVEIVDTCLAKEPVKRFQTLDELIARLHDAEHKLGVPRRRGTARTAAGGRSHRLGVTVAAVFAIAAVFVGYDFFRDRWSGNAGSVPIAVIDFVNETDEAALDGLSGMLITALDQSRRLSVMTRSRMFDLLKVLGREDVSRIDESLGQEICRAANVSALVIPTVQKFGDLYTIDLKVLDTRNNRYIFTTRKEGRGQESIPRMIDDIARDIRIDLKDPTDAVAAMEAVASVTTVNLDAYQSYFRGEELLNKLEFREAQAAFAEAIALDSTFALAHYRLAYTEWWAREKIESARSHARYAVAHIDRIPDRERYLVRALSAGLEEGFEAQIPILTEMRERYPRDKEMLFALGDAEFHSSNYDSASVHFAQVLDLDPAFERALQHQTWTFMRRRQFDRAREVARQWAEHTGSSEAYSALASACLYLDELAAAESAVRSAIAVDPESLHPYARLVELHMARDRTAQAESELHDLMGSTDPKAREHGYRLLTTGLLPYLGRYREAISILDGAIEAIIASGDSSGLALAKVAKGVELLWAYEDTASCRQLVESTLAYGDDLKPPGYWESVAGAFVACGMPERAHEILMSAPVPEMKSSIMVPIFDAVTAAHAGECDDALAVMDSLYAAVGASAQDLHLSNVWFGIGKCQVEAGQYERALECFKHYEEGQRGHVNIESAPLHPMFLLELGKALEGVGRPREAIAAYEELLALWKNADRDLPQYIEATSRLERLRAASSM